MSVAFSSYAHSMKMEKGKSIRREHQHTRGNPKIKRYLRSMIEELRGIIAVLLKLILNLSLFLSLGRVLQSLCIRH
ncbi:hypothetical protein ACS0TY_020946 [Phlomoides rotata]